MKIEGQEVRIREGERARSGLVKETRTRKAAPGSSRLPSY